MEIILDLDATGDLIHGAQEGRFFHGYSGNSCRRQGREARRQIKPCSPAQGSFAVQANPPHAKRCWAGAYELCSTDALDVARGLRQPIQRVTATEAPPKNKPVRISAPGN